MFCTHCGTQYPDDAQFCHECGNSVRQVSPKSVPTSTPVSEPAKGIAESERHTPASPQDKKEAGGEQLVIKDASEPLQEDVSEKIKAFATRTTGYAKQQQEVVPALVKNHVSPALILSVVGLATAIGATIINSMNSPSVARNVQSYKAAVPITPPTLTAPRPAPTLTSDANHLSNTNAKIDRFDIDWDDKNIGYESLPSVAFSNGVSTALTYIRNEYGTRKLILTQPDEINANVFIEDDHAYIDEAWPNTTAASVAIVSHHCGGVGSMCKVRHTYLVLVVGKNIEKYKFGGKDNRLIARLDAQGIISAFANNIIVGQDASGGDVIGTLEYRDGKVSLSGSR